MATGLITGGAGFFGGVLADRLLDAGIDCVSIDVQPQWLRRANLRSLEVDIRDHAAVDRLFAQHSFDFVFHCAAELAHSAKEKDLLWTTNVDGTRVLAEAAARHGKPKFVFISSNCLWAQNLGRPITEEDEPHPVEIYGRSKLEGEKLLQGFTSDLAIVTLRSPTIIASGRLGLLAILFEFIREGRRVWTVGPGDNRYQFVYARDLADACLLAVQGEAVGVFNVGSDNVRPLREVYQAVIDRAGTASRVTALPRAPSLAVMRAASALGLSPLGPYHYRMIAEDFVFDTSKIKRCLGWQPTLTNEEMLGAAYDHYVEHLDEIKTRRDASAHRSVAAMGAIRILKWIS